MYNKRHLYTHTHICEASQVMLVGKNLPANSGNAGDLGSIPELGRSPGVGNGNPFYYSCLENCMDRGARQATVYGESQKSDATKYACSGMEDLFHF